MTTKSMRQGGIEPPAQLISTYMAKLYFTTKPLARPLPNHVECVVCKALIIVVYDDKKDAPRGNRTPGTANLHMHGKAVFYH